MVNKSIGTPILASKEEFEKKMGAHHFGSRNH